MPIPRYAWIEGRVTDAEGAAVEHCAASASTGGAIPLAAEELARALPGFAGFERDRSSTTDADGRYRLSVVPSQAEYTVNFHPKEHAPQRSLPVLLREPGSRARVDAVLLEGGKVRGRVLRNGAPWRGYVTWTQAGRLLARAHVDAEGGYELLRVPAGIGTLAIGQLSGPSLREAALTIADGETREHDFLWDEELLPITGRIMRMGGEPAAGERVSARRHDAQGRLESFYADTDLRGRYSLAVARGGNYSVSAGKGVSVGSREGVPPGASDVDLELPLAGRIVLRLVDATTGAPARVTRSGMWVYSWRVAGEGSFQPEYLPALVGVDLEGVLALGFPAGRIDLRLSFNDEGYRTKELLNVLATVEPAREPLRVELERGIDLELRLAASEPGAKLPKGTLFFLLDEDQRDAVRGPFPARSGESNHRIDGVNVWLADGGLLNRQIHPGEQGAARVRGLAPGRYVLVAIPAEVAFEPALIEIEGESPARAELRWR